MGIRGTFPIHDKTQALEVKPLLSYYYIPELMYFIVNYTIHVVAIMFIKQELIHRLWDLNLFVVEKEHCNAICC